MLALWVLLSAAELGAQTRTAVIEGAVRDSSGGAIAGATVSLRDPETNQTRIATTNGEGSFRAADLPVGRYEIRVEDPGFAPYVNSGVTVAIGQTASLAIVLIPGGVTETVAVVAQPPPLDSRQTALATTVDTERVEELPVRSRNYLEFVLLAPGVTRSPSNPQPGAASPLRDSGFSFGGLRPSSNMLSIDGLDNTDEFSGGGRTELSLEIVREFQVVTNGWTAENGGAAGGAINVVTKGGTNVLHGDAFLFLQNGRLNARPALEETQGIKPALQRYRGGLALGGPLVKDRTFYYVAGEQEETRDHAASDISRIVANAINHANTTQTITVGLFPTARSETELSGKVTRQDVNGDSLTVRVAATNGRESGDAFNTSGLVDASARGSLGTRDIAVTSSWSRILGTAMTNETRGQFASRTAASHTTDEAGPGILIPGLAEFGRPFAGNARHRQRYAQVGDTVARTIGAHFLKGGVDVKHVGLNGQSEDGAAGVFLFRSLDAYLNHVPDSLRQTFGNPRIEIGVTRTGVFLQDQWSPTHTLTIDAGARFDAEALPSVLKISARQVAPRAGVAWTLRPKWVLRGGAGRFADRLPLAAFEAALWLDGRRGFEQISPGDQTTGTRTAIYTVRPGAWNPSSSQFGVGLEHQVTADVTASINGLIVDGRQLARTVNVGWPVSDVFERQPTASSRYRGLIARVNQRLSHEIEWMAGYTVSHSRDDASDFDEQPANPSDLKGEWGDSRYDQRHRFVASALFDLDLPPGPFSNLELAPIVTIGSGLPENPLTGADASGTHAWPLTARPSGFARNSLRTPASVTVDLRLLKFFNIKPHGKLDLVVEAFNLMNRMNVTELDPVYGESATAAAKFSRPVEAAAPRHLQVSVDFEF